jgi:hypothetical protein
MYVSGQLYIPKLQIMTIKLILILWYANSTSFSVKVKTVQSYISIPTVHLHGMVLS